MPGLDRDRPSRCSDRQESPHKHLLRNQVRSSRVWLWACNNTGGRRSFSPEQAPSQTKRTTIALLAFAPDPPTYWPVLACPGLGVSSRTRLPVTSLLSSPFFRLLPVLLLASSACSRLFLAIRAAGSTALLVRCAFFATDCRGAVGCPPCPHLSLARSPAAPFTATMLSVNIADGC